VSVEERPADSTELLDLIDRLEELLIRSQLDEIEVEADGTGIVVRNSSAIAPRATPVPAASDGSATAAEQPAEDTPASTMRAVVAPLTGLFYSAPSPGAEPYVHVGSEVHVGQVIGLIEAMKLFNEIKSDVAGRVVRICVESGALVKAKQPLIEVEP
jgi:acetyl-CoA carboxylase biotin carboxyl carrier protein